MKNGKRKMDPSVREKLLDICIKSKMSGNLSPEEMRWCEKMYNKYPEDYPTDREIFEIVRKKINLFMDD